MNDEPARVKAGGWLSDDDPALLDMEWPELVLDDQGWPIRVRELTPGTRFFTWPDRPRRGRLAVSRIV